jgi:hypothetical protein
MLPSATQPSPYPRRSAIQIVPWRAQTGPQLTAIQHDDIDELLYGGAVFGGKSDFLLGDFAQDVPRPYGKHWHGILFRKSYKQLEELISRSKEIYPNWFPGCRWSGSSKEIEKAWIWPNGATLKMRHMDSDDDWLEYWGHSYTWIGWDELGNWASDIPYMRMKARLRCAQAVIPNMRIRSSANPGGPGHQWVKRYFGIDLHPLGGVELRPRDGSNTTRMFVKARLSDNKIGMSNDPGYEKRLEGMGSPDLVRSLKDGDWNIIAGAYFPEFEVHRHVMPAFEIPKTWTRIRAMDWGSARPFCVIWAAVADGVTYPFVPRGALVCYREWYGWNGKPNEGCRMTAEEVGSGITRLESPEKMNDAVLDPSAFERDGGPSIAERMNVGFRRADNSRVAQVGRMGGWDQLRARLRGFDGKPQIYFFPNCEHTIRTLPALQHDAHKIEDVDTNAEDHAGDTVRYLVMSRPYTNDAPKKDPPAFETSLTIAELIKRQGEKRRRDE